MARMAAIIALTSALAHGNCAQAQLTLLRSFSTEQAVPLGPDGIAYHEDSDELYVVDSTSGSLFRLTMAGQLIDSFVNPELSFYEGITALPDGNLLVSDGGMGTLTVFTPELEMEEAPLDITATSSSPNGVVMVEKTDSLFITDDNVVQIMEIDPEGRLLGQFLTNDVDPSFLEPEGIAFEPASGHLLAVDDDQGRLYELTTDGQLIRDVDLEALTGFTDPEGLSYHSPTRTLFIAFDGDRQVGVFRFSPLTASFKRGDCNDDGSVDISDAINTLEMLFLGAAEGGCHDACDSNDDGALDISDAIVTLGALFLGNGVIPPPGILECGTDPTDDQADCATQPASCPQ